MKRRAARKPLNSRRKFDNDGHPVLNNWHRSGWGLFAAASAVGLKFVTQDLYWLQIAHDTRDFGKANGLIIMYLAMLIILPFVAAGFAIASRENSPFKLIGIALSAPAMITTAAGGSKPAGGTFFGIISEYVLPISTAYAADGPKLGSVESSVADGVKLWFGFGKDQSRYYVIAGPYRNENEASAAGMKIMRERPSVPVFVGDPDPKSGSSVLIIGNSLPYPDARTLRDSVKELPALKDAKDIYLSANPPSAALEKSNLSK